MMQATVLAFMLTVSVVQAVHLDFVYHNYTKMEEYLQNVNAQYPNLTQLYSIGQSVKGRQLWVLAVSSTPAEHVAGKPEMKYVGNIHGNEPISKEILLHSILYLVTNYGRDDRVTRLLDATRIHFLPSMNPDGFEVSRSECTGEQGRTNARGVDLNRNFPDYFRETPGPRQPETTAIMTWMHNVTFVLSASLHGGALVASYPYESSEKPVHIQKNDPNISPDDDVFQHLARTYSTTHTTMSREIKCPGQIMKFKDGIVNGVHWYLVVGGMQDYNYLVHGTMEVTLEVGCCKYPPSRDIESHWNENKQALLAYAEQIRRGVRGFVTNEEGAPLHAAKLRIAGRRNHFYTTTLGEFWRILLDGNYVLEVNAEGYQKKRLPFTVNGTEATVLNVTMTHPDQFEDELQIFSSYDEPEELFDAPEDDAPPTELAERIDHTTAPSGSSVNCFPFHYSVLFLAILQCVQLFE